jgi:drug/metabolite transporter (DMT)-like permease
MKLNNLQLLLLLSLCWGPSFLFIKIALSEVSPLMLSAIRIGSGAFILNLMLLAKGHFLPGDFKFWKDVSIAGLFSVLIPFLLINWGQQFVDSSLGALLNGTTPFFTVLFTFAFLKNEGIALNNLSGILIGFFGLLVLVFPYLRDGVTASLLGIGSIALAAASYGLGWVWVQKKLTKVQSFTAPAAQLLIVSVVLVPIALIFDREIVFTQMSWSVFGSLAFLGSFGTAVAFIIYFKLIEKAGANYASMITYIVPVFGLFLGVWILNESLTIWTISGAAIILFGIYLGNRKPVKYCCPEGRIDFGVFSKVR